MSYDAPSSVNNCQIVIYKIEYNIRGHLILNLLNSFTRIDKKNRQGSFLSNLENLCKVWKLYIELPLIRIILQMNGYSIGFGEDIRILVFQICMLSGSLDNPTISQEIIEWFLSSPLWG